MFSSVHEEIAMEVTAANKIVKKNFFMFLKFKVSNESIIDLIEWVKDD